MSNRKQCSCGAWIVMVPTGRFRDNGQPVVMPLNEELVDGVTPNVNVIDDVAVVVKKDEVGAWQPHHATCPNSERWHRRVKTAELTRESRTTGPKPRAMNPKGIKLDRLDTALPGF